MNDNHRQYGSSGSPDAASWFVRLQRRPHDEELKKSFEAWLDADPRHPTQWAQVAGAWERLGDLKDDPQILAARGALQAELDAQRRRPQMRWAAGVAAALVAGGAVLGLGILRQEPNAGAAPAPAAPQVLATYRTPVGGQQPVILADGSKVTLSTDTEVRLTEWNRRRALTLVKGEAFFEVARNPDKPFVVTAAGRTVTALGTAFDIRVDQDQWSVSLLEGKVRVASPDAQVDLAPGGHLVQTGDRPWTVATRSPAELASWRSGSLTFDDQPLASIVEEMNRYSEQKVRITDPKLAATRLSGRFKTGDMTGFVATLEAYGMARASHSSDTAIELKPVAGG